MKRSVKKLSTISGKTPDNCPFTDRSFARCSRKARAFSFSLRLRAEYPGAALSCRLVSGAPLMSVSGALVNPGSDTTQMVRKQRWVFSTLPFPLKRCFPANCNRSTGYILSPHTSGGSWDSIALRRNCLRQDSWYRSPMTALGASIFPKQLPHQTSGKVLDVL
jgi:hypothetical protein